MISFSAARNKAIPTFQEYAGDAEILDVVVYSDVYYVYSSELGCLRLYRAYGGKEGSRAFFSVNLDRWVFVLPHTMSDILVEDDE